MNYFEYISTYDYTFADKKFNEVDTLVLSCIMYLDFSSIVPNKKTMISLKDAGKIYLETYKKREISKLGLAQKDAYKLLELATKSSRYSSIMLTNYRYITSLDSQFSAMTFVIDKKLKFIGFEGTDELLSGWKEDAYLSFKFPVDAQKYAIEYINEVTSLFDAEIILGGHSKGGNLALVSGMYSKFYIRDKISKIYSHDGPGLRKEEFYSKKYKKIKNKYIHVIPSHSLIGTLLYNGAYQVIKTTNKNILAHIASSWVIEENSFVLTKQDKKSHIIEEKLNKYIASISYEEQEKIVKAIFNDLEKKGYKTLNELLNFRMLLKSIKGLKHIDPEIKGILSDVVDIIVTSYL